MTMYRSPMEKILHEGENATVITNPKQQTRTFFRKLAFRLAVLRSKLGRRDQRRPSTEATKGPEE
jgi:hypothetical protein